MAKIKAKGEEENLIDETNLSTYMAKQTIPQMVKLLD